MSKSFDPVEDGPLLAALEEIHAVYDRHGLTGACMLINEDSGAFVYRLAAEWTAFRSDPDAEFGFRLRAVTAEDGRELTWRRVEGAVHTACALADFGSQTMDWMEQIKLILRQSGIDFEHNPFGGVAPPPIVGKPG